jgi:hypothetical protein
MKRVEDTVLRRRGAARVCKRTYIWRGEPIEERYFLEQPIPGKRGQVTKTWFDQQGSAERALAAVGAVREDEWWRLSRLVSTSPAPSSRHPELWRLSQL